ncbi:MAG: DUF3489 domain-containing protein [Rhodoplanes sp.]
MAVGASAAEPDQSPPRPHTKQALIVSLLTREAGASLDELVSATRWLPHTTRAALTRLRQVGKAGVGANAGSGARASSARNMCASAPANR